MQRDVLEESKDAFRWVLVAKRVEDEVVTGEEGVAIHWNPCLHLESATKELKSLC